MGHRDGLDVDGQPPQSGGDPPRNDPGSGAGRDGSELPPQPATFASVFDVYETRSDGETAVYVGDPLVSPERVERELYPLFRERGYELSLQRGYRGGSGFPITSGEYALVAEPRSVGVDGIPWTNVVLFLATVASTLFAGAFFWYQVPLVEQPLRILEAWPFTLAIVGVLGIHELGHYVMSRYHGVQASLPYFIPLPTYIGSLGAVIRMRGQIPNRRALFDIGVAGPLAGLVATVVVTAVGLQLEPLAVQEATLEGSGGSQIRFNYPPLLEIVAAATGTTGRLESGVLHPVVFGGWVGMLVTLLNMLPVGQLDGGHILRAMAGERQRDISRLVPYALFGLAGALFLFRGFDSVTIWALWGVFALVLAAAGPANPLDDRRLDRGRFALGVLTFVLALLCFTPVPVEIVEAA
jgi:membrane-associated protease RseP (regulator of RpoE activity)